MSTTGLNKVLKELNSGNARYFDPLRFAYIQSLSRRQENRLHASNEVLADKLRVSAKEYLRELKSCRTKSRKTLKQLTKDFPEHAEAANKLYERCDFKSLETLNHRLKHRNAGLSALNELNSVFKKIIEQANTEKKTNTLEQALSVQEESLLGKAVVENNIDGQLPELQSTKVFRESIKHFKIDKVIDRAISDLPENPGPHNPHMLAIKSITSMHDLSPNYLRRFAGYIETLLWLEKKGIKISNIK